MWCCGVPGVRCPLSPLRCPGRARAVLLIPPPGRASAAGSNCVALVSLLASIGRSSAPAFRGCEPGVPSCLLPILVSGWPRGERVPFVAPSTPALPILFAPLPSPLCLWGGCRSPPGRDLSPGSSAALGPRVPPFGIPLSPRAVWAPLGFGALQAEHGGPTPFPAQTRGVREHTWLLAPPPLGAPSRTPGPAGMGFLLRPLLAFS